MSRSSSSSTRCGSGSGSGISSSGISHGSGSGGLSSASGFHVGCVFNTQAVRGDVVRSHMLRSHAHAKLLNWMHRALICKLNLESKRRSENCEVTNCLPLEAKIAMATRAPAWSPILVTHVRNTV